MTIITSTSELQNLCEQLKNQQFITIDTEFLRDKTYFPKLCLMQIGLDHDAVIIDTLSPSLDLSPLFTIFDNSNIIKVFHAASQDLEIIFNLYGKIPYPIFDTQIAAMFCGFGNTISYNNLSMQLIGIKIDKTYQFTDWSLRPLNNEQIAYALNDVRYLRIIYEKLLNKLHELRRNSWIEEEMNLVSHRDNFLSNPEQAWLKLKVNYQNANIGLLKKLASWREINAQHINIPRGHLIKDEILVEICKIMPTAMAQLKNIIPRYNKHFINNDQLSTSLLTIIQLYLEENKLPNQSIEISTLSSYNKNLYSLLKLLLKMKSAEYNIAANTIAHDEDLNTISSDPSTKQLNKLRVMQGWRYQIFGKDIVHFQQGKLAITMNNNQIVTVNI